MSAQKRGRGRPKAQAAAGGPEQQQPGPEAFEGGEQADGEEDGKVTLGKRQRI